ncbi:uncharacterized protein BO95DRAFT_12642 [Aspergillus brunneoviolaceus CBS 621.78]|uniref:Uncharacterized protein n=1 Tax=Aspergillus brunneoviolaceus CBS 621.78 TaxID=1450534 RepID=A0ACD1GJB2_9EURO|nr:hypothetical protein BO95DRAFT_12642 [Aspergillus brunneoviolaceus CBS 621.78]RAH49252.1 hypothetical protein BO95DRAFT_12642 [Aspergillus brunneoviolaceus CBS 621.78]
MFPSSFMTLTFTVPELWGVIVVPLPSALGRLRARPNLNNTNPKDRKGAAVWAKPRSQSPHLGCLVFEMDRIIGSMHVHME